MSEKQHVEVATVGRIDWTPSKSEPAWTSTPPSEPGWYWVRSTIDMEAAIAEIALCTDGLLYIWPDDAEREIRLGLMENAEFWPIPISEPPR